MDDEVGLVNMNARIYDPVLGRFLSADGVLPDAYDMQQYNRYSYVSNNPLAFVDPSGNISVSVGIIFYGSRGSGRYYAGNGLFDSLPRVSTNWRINLLPGALEWIRSIIYGTGGIGGGVPDFGCDPGPCTGGVSTQGGQGGSSSVDGGSTDIGVGPGGEVIVSPGAIHIPRGEESEISPYQAGNAIHKVFQEALRRASESDEEVGGFILRDAEGVLSAVILEGAETGRVGGRHSIYIPFDSHYQGLEVVGTFHTHSSSTVTAFPSPPINNRQDGDYGTLDDLAIDRRTSFILTPDGYTPYDSHTGTNNPVVDITVGNNAPPGADVPTSGHLR